MGAGDIGVGDGGPSIMRSRPALPLEMTNSVLRNDLGSLGPYTALPDEPSPAPAPRVLGGPRPQPPSKILHAPITVGTTLASATRLPLAQSSAILVHSGFWNILAATGSRFYSAAIPGVESGSSKLGDVVDRGYLGLKGNADTVVERRAVTSPGLGPSALIQRKDISVGMIGQPTQFAYVAWPV